MKIADHIEKQFIHDIFGSVATTAKSDQFDDAVVVDLASLTNDERAPYIVYSLDQPSFVRHIDDSIDPYRFYGRWVAGTTCNDVIAMGARCRGFSLALAAPPTTLTDDVKALLDGIGDVLSICGATYEGGNLDSGELATVGYAWGVASRDALVRRSGAKPGDLIVVTGSLGLGWLEYLLRKHELSSLIASRDKMAFYQYKSMPVGAAVPIAEVAERGWFTSGMDLSDGLVEFLYTIRGRNGLGCRLNAEALPVPEVARRNIGLLRDISPRAAHILEEKPWLLALEPGYDSPLRHAFTIVPEAVDAAQQLFGRHDSALHVIGTVSSQPSVSIRQGERDASVPPFWDDQLRQLGVIKDWADFICTFA